MLRARLVLGVCCLFLPVAAQSQLPRGDSLRILSRAHSAQTEFERVHRHFTPTADDVTAQACETEIGRMCYWQENDDEHPVAEPRSISEARFALISTLGRLGALSPHDDWIAGQHIRYMIEAGEDSAAVTAARACTATRWYCKTLLGYALHASEQYGDAIAEFDSAFTEMLPVERCRWNDISVLLEDAERDSYERIPCGQRDSVEQRFWELAQPSFAVAGNDRRTEHYSRMLLADLSQDAANAYGLTWGPDMRELLIRYGPARWYTTTWPRPFDPTPTPTGHDRTPSFHFVAEITGSNVHWDAHAHVARERYSPPYIDTLTDLNAQFAMMKRGDSALVVAIYSDTSTGRALLGIAGAVSDTTPGDPEFAHVRRVGTKWKGVMVAMEEFDPTRRRDARAREWLAPPPRVQGAPELSTLLLFTADTSARVESLDDALAHALTANELRGTRRLGLYWEVYGAGPDSSSTSNVPNTTSNSQSSTSADSTSRDSAAVQVTVTRTSGGVMQWLGEALHITHGNSPVAVRWKDTSAGSGISTHSIVLDLAQLPAATYRVTVAVGPDPAHRTDVSREIRLR